MKKLLDEKGQIEVLFLFIVFILFLAVGWGVRLVQNVTLGDVNLKGAVALAVKGAARQFEEDFIAPGQAKKTSANFKSAAVLAEKSAAEKSKQKELVIIPEQALETFKSMLAANLGLNPQNLTPLKNSVWIKEPDYTLIVYNGTSGVKYNSRDGQLTQVDIPAEGFPAELELQGIKITLASPGVIASVEITARGIFGKELTFERWAGARVTEDGEVVVLGKNG